ncbi:hypothetical protein SARC_15786 [Sphaeroforma arctica JP610]|uniref:Histone deacetylase domain-containing protein n=1 Tax=Sphaeroforma arctica JP610 TaxID=667725 RepID=A0A0L0F501_9EUKA|nr:hypothetical protein SARC_15786 [Sphaeroforma arctica JP610]KNC71674.1 hypothetical protein SARC_15786 [Sphaeroforma arctica JP610]|eukprot:XP_014145576.1 hypothetical protein SARC_15786 [Sphaeroforma arctica JP610]
MTCVEPQKATKQEMAAFHTDEYISFLESVTTKPIASDAAKLYMHNVFEDCPVFPGLYDFCRSSAGSSIGGAVALNCRDSVIAINWSGGLHHAMRSAASGFCYVNDIVLAILELLK